MRNATPAETPTVLIVDDEAAGRETLNALLASEGYRLLFAANGPTALQMATAERPDVILLDLMMPGMDGFEVCTTLRADPELAEVPVIILTALDDRGARLRALQTGADDFVTKPFDRLELRTRIRATLRFNRYRRLLAERERFRWVVERARDGYLLLDADTVPTYANPAARHLLGIAPEAVLDGTPFLTLARRQYRPEPAVGWTHWPATPPDLPLYLVRPETPVAPVLWLEVSCLSSSTSATPAPMVVRLTDVTAQITARIEMHAFRTLISHKLRTPMHHIHGALDLLMTDDSLAPDEIRHFARVVFDGADRLRVTIEHVLRDMESVCASNDCVALDTLADAVARACGATRLDPAHVQVTVAPELTGRELPVSATSLDLVLVELLENARKFHPQQAPAVAVEAVADGSGGVRLRIIDDGVSLSPAQLERAWIPYYQADKHLAGEIPGIGLGLSYVATIVWRAGGDCRLRNRDDRPGLIVELRLPTPE